MKVFIKVLRGDGCSFDVDGNITVVDVKHKIEQELKVPVNQQTLVFLGKTLVDEKALSFYPKIQDGCKLHLVIKKPESFKVVLGRLLLKYYSKEEVDLIVDEFMRDFNEKISTLSLDDLERIATSYLDEGSM